MMRGVVLRAGREGVRRSVEASLWEKSLCPPPCELRPPRRLRCLQEGVAGGPLSSRTRTQTRFLRDEGRRG